MDQTLQASVFLLIIYSICSKIFLVENHFKRLRNTKRIIMGGRELDMSSKVVLVIVAFLSMVFSFGGC